MLIVNDAEGMQKGWGRERNEARKNVNVKTPRLYEREKRLKNVTLIDSVLRISVAQNESLVVLIKMQRQIDGRRCAKKPERGTGTHRTSCPEPASSHTSTNNSPNLDVKRHEVRHSIQRRRILVQCFPFFSLSSSTSLAVLVEILCPHSPMNLV
jgi:hypothetical protein